eukprot:Protomagalhaensia_sp_Gyna_25__973@NODE_146_length_4895_cov_17_531507_g113_i0_p2_GENE_NODE_146_length_4895_cov_17_531507_g113_i0NODE_146_length_4895_cov_17_531507_g113_i0_p2_ORF_typecomplete_len431_score55_46EMP70/PF02990_16/6e55MFS_1/PF07690_16/0_017DUF4070/PF13282_6/0_22FtsX/PF02687_21/67FtsX/PF02687_21/2e02_NODE_146_length_4895_cov_17_531507_g113_i0331325
MLSSLWVVGSVIVLAAGEEGHRYTVGEKVQVWADRTGPWSSPRETYSFEELPLCELWGLDPERKPLSLGEAFEGIRHTLSPRLEIAWPGNDSTPTSEASREICRLRMTDDIVRSLAALIQDNWYYSYAVDGLPVQAFLGENKEEPKLYAHKTFAIEKNGDQIISVSIVPGNPVKLLRNQDLKLTYNVEWIDTDAPFSTRMKKYYTSSFFEWRIQWFSLSMSVVFGAFVASTLFVVLARTIREDFAAGFIDETEAFDKYEEAGWKRISKEVFRKPKKLRMYSILCSTGWHLAATGILATIAALVRVSWGYRALSTGGLWWLYALTQPINGFTGSYYYSIYGGHQWKSAVLWQLVAFPLLLAVCFLQLNTAYAAFGSTMAVSLGQVLLGKEITYHPQLLAMQHPLRLPSFILRCSLLARLEDRGDLDRLRCR